MNTNNLYFGIVVASIHLLLVVPLGVYFGLGFSYSGAWFLENLYLQPGALIYKSMSSFTDFKPIVFMVNFVFYFAVGAYGRKLFRVHRRGKHYVRSEE